MSAHPTVEPAPARGPLRREKAGDATAQWHGDAPRGRAPALLQACGDGADLCVLTEAELAALRAVEGASIKHRHGRYWQSTRRGFYQPVHMLSRVRANEAARPSPLCWGYRTALAEEDVGAANATIPMYLLAEVDGFAEGLSRNRKGDLRKCRRLVEFQVLPDPSILLEQGHRVFTSAIEGRGDCKPMTEAEYRRHVQYLFEHRRTQIVAGLVHGELAGYFVACAVDGVLYLDHTFVCPDARRTGIGTGLYVVSIENALRSGRVHTVCNSFHTPEVPSLCHYKESLGFVVNQVPARLSMPAPALSFVRHRQPAVYYRLTGDLPRSLAVDPDAPAADVVRRSPAKGDTTS